MKVTPPEGGPVVRVGASGIGGARAVPTAADIPIAGGYYGTGTVEAALAALAAAVAALQGTTGTTYWPMLALTSGPVASTGQHVSDTTAAHAAAAISFTPNGSIAATDVQAAIQEVRDEASGSGIPATIVDVKGDLIAATAADTVARLAAAANGAALITASGEATGLKWRLNNDGAAVAPTVNEDSGDGYQIGSRWLDTTADKEYVCLDATVAAAVWVETTVTGGSTITTKDEGSTLSTAVTTLDFVGAGVTATGAGATTTVTISGSGSSTYTVLSDTFNRADGAVGNADGGPLQVWQASSGTWEIFTNRLRETGAGGERFIFTYAGYQRGLRTFVWTMNTKPTTGDGGLVFRAPYGGSTVAPLLLLNVEATYKLYSLGGGGVYTAVTVSSGTPVAPVNGDVITVVDDGIQVKVSVNGGAQVVYVNTTLQGGPFVGFRNSSGGGMTHDSIVVTDT